MPKKTKKDENLSGTVEPPNSNAASPSSPAESPPPEATQESSADEVKSGESKADAGPTATKSPVTLTPLTDASELFRLAQEQRDRDLLLTASDRKGASAPNDAPIPPMSVIPDASLSTPTPSSLPSVQGATTSGVTLDVSPMSRRFALREVGPPPVEGAATIRATMSDAHGTIGTHYHLSSDGSCPGIEFESHDPYDARLSEIFGQLCLVLPPHVLIALLSLKVPGAHEPTKNLQLFKEPQKGYMMTLDGTPLMSSASEGVEVSSTRGIPQDGEEISMDLFNAYGCLSYGNRVASAVFHPLWKNGLYPGPTPGNSWAVTNVSQFINDRVQPIAANLLTAPNLTHAAAVYPDFVYGDRTAIQQLARIPDYCSNLMSTAAFREAFIGRTLRDNHFVIEEEDRAFAARVEQWVRLRPDLVPRDLRLSRSWALSTPIEYGYHRIYFDPINFPGHNRLHTDPSYPGWLLLTDPVPIVIAPSNEVSNVTVRPRDPSPFARQLSLIANPAAANDALSWFAKITSDPVAQVMLPTTVSHHYEFDTPAPSDMFSTYVGIAITWAFTPASVFASTKFRPIDQFLLSTSAQTLSLDQPFCLTTPSRLSRQQLPVRVAGRGKVVADGAKALLKSLFDRVGDMAWVRFDVTARAKVPGCYPHVLYVPGAIAPHLRSFHDRFYDRESMPYDGFSAACLEIGEVYSLIFADYYSLLDLLNSKSVTTGHISQPREFGVAIFSYFTSIIAAMMDSTACFPHYHFAHESLWHDCQKHVYTLGLGVLHVPFVRSRMPAVLEYQSPVPLPPTPAFPVTNVLKQIYDPQGFMFVLSLYLTFNSIRPSLSIEVLHFVVELFFYKVFTTGEVPTSPGVPLALGGATICHFPKLGSPSAYVLSVYRLYMILFKMTAPGAPREEVAPGMHATWWLSGAAQMALRRTLDGMLHFRAVRVSCNHWSGIHVSVRPHNYLPTGPYQLTLPPKPATALINTTSLSALMSAFQPNPGSLTVSDERLCGLISSLSKVHRGPITRRFGAPAYRSGSSRNAFFQSSVPPPPPKHVPVSHEISEVMPQPVTVSMSFDSLFDMSRVSAPCSLLWCRRLLDRRFRFTGREAPLSSSVTLSGRWLRVGLYHDEYFSLPGSQDEAGDPTGVATFYRVRAPISPLDYHPVTIFKAFSGVSWSRSAVVPAQGVSPPESHLSLFPPSLSLIHI